MRLGVDFGTTRTVVAVADRGNYPVVGFEASGELHEYVPTLAATDGEAWVYGWAAAARLGTPGWQGLRSFKRLLSGAGARPGRVVRVGAQEVPLEELVVGFLTALRVAILEASNLPKAHDEDLEVMVAVPAGASSGQRFLTMEAFRAAGFAVQGLLNEPSAASVEYANRYQRTLTSKREDVLVYDLGGGTFDASIVRVSGEHYVLGHTGLGDVGGEDFDEVLLQLALAQVGRRVSELSAAQRVELLEHCRGQKEGLHPNTRRVMVELDEDTAVTLKTAEYYSACAALVSRTVDCLGDLLPSGEGERLDSSSLAGVYVVGGASDLPVVARTLRALFPRRVKRSPYASASVAVGLAIAADGRGPCIHEQLSRTFGVFREVEGGDAIAFDPILRSEQATGTDRVRRYRPVHNIGHFRFVACDRLSGGVPDGAVTPFSDLRFAFDPSLRSQALGGLPVERCGAGPLIEERYHVDEQGIVEVAITDLESGYSVERRFV